MARVRDFIDSYRLVRLIRAGKTTQVWEAVRGDDDSRYALKILLEDEKNFIDLENSPLWLNEEHEIISRDD